MNVKRYNTALNTIPTISHLRMPVRYVQMDEFEHLHAAWLVSLGDVVSVEASMPVFLA